MNTILTWYKVKNANGTQAMLRREKPGPRLLAAVHPSRRVPGESRHAGTSTLPQSTAQVLTVLFFAFFS